MRVRIFIGEITPQRHVFSHSFFTDFFSKFSLGEAEVCLDGPRAPGAHTSASFCLDHGSEKSFLPLPSLLSPSQPLCRRRKKKKKNNPRTRFQRRHHRNHKPLCENVRRCPLPSHLRTLQTFQDACFYFCHLTERYICI